MAKSNVSKTLKIQTFTKFHFESCNGTRMTKIHPQRVSIFFVDIFELNMIPNNLWLIGSWRKIKFRQSYLMTCGCPKCLMNKVRTRLKQTSKKHYLKHSSYVLPFRKILKHSTIADLFKTAWIKHCTIPHTSWRRDLESSKYFRLISILSKCFEYKIRYRLPCFG